MCLRRYVLTFLRNCRECSFLSRDPWARARNVRSVVGVFRGTGAEIYLS